jgi:RND family efflux transporter MFP subunit
LLAALGFVTVATAGCKSGSALPASAKGVEQRDARQVQTTPAQEVLMERAITVTGTLAAYDQAVVSVKVPGRVLEIKVDLGSVVREGQLIAQLDPQDYKLQLKQAEAALAQARARVGLTPEGGGDEQINIEQTSTVRQARAVLDEAVLKYERAKTLSNQGVISRAQLDTAEAEHKVAMSRYQDAIEEVRNREALVVQRRSELDIIRQRVSDLSIYAPFNGVIQEKRASIGEYLAAGSPIVNIVRTDPLRLRVEVPEREARNVRQGLRVRVTVEGDPNSYSGQIARLSPTITAQNRILMVEAEVRNNGQLRPGAFARAEIVSDEGTPTLSVPANAIVTFAGIEKVITIQDGKALEKQITTGRRNNEWVEVLTGLTAGEPVIVNPGNLQSGQPVTVANQGT